MSGLEAETQARTTTPQLGKEPLETELNFHLKQSKELNDVRADMDLLMEVASQTQGKNAKVFRPDEVNEILRKFRISSESREDNPETRIWDHWLMMVLFFALLTTEWVVRKLNGLP